MKRYAIVLLCAAMILSVMAGCTPTTSGSAGKTQKFTAGTYQASAQGMNGSVLVTVTVSENRIESVEVGENAETLGLGDIAAERMPARIVEAQSLAVDVTSGATITSSAILRAVEDALRQAGGNIDELKQKAADAPLKKGKTESVDIVIVGGGLAGVMAAYDLEEKHPDVSYVVLEKMDVILGSLPMAGGAIIAPKSKLHAAQGLECTLDDIVDLMEVATGGPVREGYIKNIYSNAEEVFNRLVDWGAPLDNPTLSREASSDKVYAFWAIGRGAGFAKFLNEHVKNNPSICACAPRLPSLWWKAAGLWASKCRTTKRNTKSAPKPYCWPPADLA